MRAICVHATVRQNRISINLNLLFVSGKAHKKATPRITNKLLDYTDIHTSIPRQIKQSKRRAYTHKHEI